MHSYLAAFKQSRQQKFLPSSSVKYVTFPPDGKVSMHMVSKRAEVMFRVTRSTRNSPRTQQSLVLSACLAFLLG